MLRQRRARRHVQRGALIKISARDPTHLQKSHPTRQRDEITLGAGRTAVLVVRAAVEAWIIDIFSIPLNYRLLDSCDCLTRRALVPSVSAAPVVLVVSGGRDALNHRNFDKSLKNQ